MLTLPVAYSFGLQLDGAYARLREDNFGSVGAHLFWRDPTVGLLGLYAGYARLDGIEFGRTGVEAQYFTRQVTLDTAAGEKFGDIKEQAYGRVRLQFYPIEDLMLRAGWLYEGTGFTSAGLEYQIAAGESTGVSLFVDGNVHSNDNYSILWGVKITFGKNMNLKDRHRRQDPDGYVAVDLQQASPARAANTPQDCVHGGATNCDQTLGPKL